MFRIRQRIRQYVVVQLSRSPSHEAVQTTWALRADAND